MDAFVNFLLDYYVWILAVLGIIIVTIIGFLVDSRRKRGKVNEQVTKNSVEEVKTVESLPDTTQQNTAPVEDISNQTVSAVSDIKLDSNGTNVSAPVEQIGTFINTIDQNAQTPVENNQTQISLNEQRPHFESRNIDIPVVQQNGLNSNNMEQVVVPQPVNAVHINHPVQMQQQPVMPVQESVSNQVPVQNVNSQVEVSAVPQNMQYSMAQNTVYGYNSPQMTTQYSQVQPQSMVGNVGVSQTQPVQPQVQNSYNQVSASSAQPQFNSAFNNQQVVVPTSPVTQPIQQPVSVSLNQTPADVTNSNNNAGLNFVTGEQNTNDDMWKL